MRTPRPAMLVAAAAVLAAGLALVPRTTAQPTDGVPPTEAELLSYGVGYAIGEELLAGLAADGVTLDLDLAAGGFAEALRGVEPRYDAQAMRDLLRAKKAEVDLARAQRLYEEDEVFRQLADDNARWAERYMQGVRAEPGTRVLEGGVLFRELQAGTGPSPMPGDTIVVDFRRMNMNGQVFDSGEGEAVRLDTLPEGSKIAARQMRAGGRYFVVVPPDLAFGLAGQVPAIGPNEAVTFEVTLKEVR